MARGLLSSQMKAEKGSDGFLWLLCVIGRQEGLDGSYGLGTWDMAAAWHCLAQTLSGYCMKKD